MAKAIRRSGVRRVSLSEIKNDLSRYLREAEGEEIVITRDGKPAGVLIGFSSEDDWFDYQLENDRAFCVASSRRAAASERAAASGSKMSNEDARKSA